MVCPLQHGSFKINVDSSSLLIEGRGEVFEHMLSFFLEEHFHDQTRSFIRIKGVVRPSFLEHFNLAKLSSFALSPFDAALTYYFDERPVFYIKANFYDTLLKLGGFFKKPKKTPASLAVEVNLSERKLQDLHFKTDFLSLRGDVFFADDWSPKGASLVGSLQRWQDFLLTFTHINETLRFNLSGKCLHAKALLESFLKSEPSKRSDAWDGKKIVAEMFLDKVVFEPGYPLYNFALNFEGLQKGTDLEMSKLFIRGQIPAQKKKGKEHTFSIRKKEKPKSFSFIEAKTTQAGYFAGALGMLSNLRGGSLLLNLDQEKKGDAFSGFLVAKDFYVQKTTLTQRFFVTLTSPTSFLRLFSNGDMLVSDLRMRFTLDEGVLDIKRANASCVDTAFSWHGWVDFQKEGLDIAGNVIPAYFLNRLITSIPIFGRLIAGSKDDGLFATRFYIKGKLSDPKVGANPLQVITPGFLKEQFQEEDIKKIQQTKPQKT